jgi:hypothetical protein
LIVVSLRHTLPLGHALVSRMRYLEKDASSVAMEYHHKNKRCVRKRTRRKFKTETKRRQLLTFRFFSGPTLRRSPVVAHEEEKTTINQNLLTKKEQAKESELG